MSRSTLWPRNHPAIGEARKRGRWETGPKIPTARGVSSDGSPVCGMVRTYRRGWLRFDLVAGVVLAAILVPQGMAYAELAGLPPETGLYTTIACLVGYAIFGPSRVLVLGPDSSVSPLIFAAITPLLVAGDSPAEGHRSGGHVGSARRPHRDRARAGQARLRRRPALQGGPGRLHERAGDHDHRRAAAEALRLLHRRRRVRGRGPPVRHEPRSDRTGPHWCSAHRCSRCC